MGSTDLPLYEPFTDRERVVTILTISPKYQVVIPKEIREKLDLRPGQRVQAIQYAGRVELVPVRAMGSMRGFLTGIETTVDRDKDRL
jgi:AbrB family looped-hinge helix DNA binding protein